MPEQELAFLILERWLLLARLQAQFPTAALASMLSSEVLEQETWLLAIDTTRMIRLSSGHYTRSNSIIGKRLVR